MFFEIFGVNLFHESAKSHVFFDTFKSHVSYISIYSNKVSSKIKWKT